METNPITAINTQGAIEVTVRGEQVEIWPEQLTYYVDLVQMVHRLRCWEALSDEAKSIFNWLCYSASDEQLKTRAGYKRSEIIITTFSKRWGRAKVVKAIAEIKKFLKI